MKSVAFIAFLLLFSVWIAAPVCAQDPIVYPAEGQSEDQMEKDKFECYTWSRDKTGFDPMKTPTTQTGPPAKEKEVWGAGKTAVAGGAGGAIVGGAMGGRKGLLTGGLIGAAGGAAVGAGRRSSQRNREEQKRKEWEQREANNYARARNEYNRAFGACMEGRGYSVK
jgi:hypothetical protein